MFTTRKTVWVTGKEEVQIFSPEELRHDALKRSPHKLKNPNLSAVVIESIRLVEATNDKNIPLMLHFNNDRLDEFVGTTMVGKKTALAVLSPLAGKTESLEPLKIVLTKKELKERTSAVISTLHKPSPPDDDKESVFLLDITHPAYLALERAFVEAIVEDEIPHKLSIKESKRIHNTNDLRRVAERHVLRQVVVDLSKSGLVLHITPLIQPSAQEIDWLVNLTLELEIGMVESNQDVIRE